MSAELLLREFDRISDVPGAVTRLRQLVIDVALRGELLPQDPTDEPAPFDDVKTRKTVSPPTTSVPFPLPQRWRWSYVGAVAYMENGDRSKNYPSKVHRILAGIPFVNAGHLQDEVIAKSELDFISEDRFQSLRSGKFLRDDILFCLRGSLGKVARVSNIDRGAIASSLIILRPNRSVEGRFLYLSLKSQIATKQIREFNNGTAQPNLAGKDLGRFWIPLPPLAEQRRIVAKVDEFMALCNELEIAQNERESRRDAVREASLQRLTVSDPDEGLAREDIRFALGQMSRLIRKADHIPAVRQTVLDLAMRGRLVQQDLAAVFGDSLPAPPSSLAGPYNLPPCWHWATVAQVGSARLGKMLDKAKNRGTPRRYLRNVNVRWFDFDLSDVKVMPFEDDEVKEFALRVGDVLICEGGEPGRAAVWDGRDTDIYFQKALHRVRLDVKVMPSFFVYYLRAAADAGRLRSYATGMTFQHLTGQSLASLLVPIPPVAEQGLIVTKIENLMAVCDELENALASAQTERARLLEALLHEALNNASDQ